MKLVLAVLLVLLLSTGAYALGDAEQSQRQGQGQEQGQMQGQGQIAAQAQGQLGIVGQKSSNDQSTTINQGGDDTETYANAWPTVPSSPTKEEKAIYSLFGGIGSNKTEEHIKIQQAMQIAETLKKNGILTDEEYKTDLLKLYKQLKASLKPQKLLGFIPIAERGCSVLNLCGMANW